MLSNTLRHESSHKHVPPPPVSIEEWFERERIAYQDWPSVKSRKAESVLVYELGLTPFSQFESVMTDLSEHANFDDILYNQLEGMVCELSDKVNKLGSHVYKIEVKDETGMKAKGSDPFLSEETGSETESSEESDTPMKANSPLSLLSSNERIGRKPGKQPRAVRGQRGAGDKSGKRAENAIFMGFDDQELTPLPGQVEPIRILDFVSQNQNFTNSYFKSWKKMFYSESSNAILQDFFWAVWLEKFNTESDIEPDTEFKFFMRCSFSYVDLFERIPVKFRDLFFMKYSDCLSQAIYVAYWALFPGSRVDFDESFRHFITTLVYNVVIGLEPPPLIWNEWRIDPDKFSQSIPLPQEKPADTSVLAKSSSPSADKLERISSDTDKNKLIDYSPEIGLSPIFHNVKFNVLGKSPLVKCYMHAQGVKSSRGPTLIKRTEILALPKPMKSYKQVMENIRKETNIRNIELEKLLHSKELDIKRNWKVCRKEIQLLKTESKHIKPKPRMVRTLPE